MESPTQVKSGFKFTPDQKVYEQGKGPNILYTPVKAVLKRRRIEIFQIKGLKGGELIPDKRIHRHTPSNPFTSISFTDKSGKVGKKYYAVVYEAEKQSDGSIKWKKIATSRNYEFKKATKLEEGELVAEEAEDFVP